MDGSRSGVRRELASRIAAGLPALARYVRARLGPTLSARESAADIVQSTARELLNARRFEDRGEESFQRWLRVAAERKLQNRVRHWRALRRAADEAPLSGDEIDPEEKLAGAPLDEAILNEERERLARAVAALPSDQRLALLRVHIDGESYDLVAAETARSPEAVRKLCARALAKLAGALRDQ